MCVYKYTSFKPFLFIALRVLKVTHRMGTGSFVSAGNCKSRRAVPGLFRPKETQLPRMLLVTFILCAFAGWGFSC